MGRKSTWLGSIEECDGHDMEFSSYLRTMFDNILGGSVSRCVDPGTVYSAAVDDACILLGLARNTEEVRESEALVASSQRRYAFPQIIRASLISFIFHQHTRPCASPLPHKEQNPQCLVCDFIRIRAWHPRDHGRNTQSAQDR